MSADNEFKVGDWCYIDKTLISPRLLDEAIRKGIKVDECYRVLAVTEGDYIRSYSEVVTIAGSIRINAIFLNKIENALQDNIDNIKDLT